MKIKKILVSQPKPENGKSPYYDIAEQYGVEVVFRPFIKVEDLPVKEFRQQKINIADFTGVIFTAKTAVDNFFRLAEETRVSIPDTMKYMCTSESVANYLQKYIVYRKRKIFFGLTGKLDDDQLLQHFSKHSKEKYLLPVSDVTQKDVAVLDRHKINYTKAVMYRTVTNDFTPDEPFDYDVLIFFSPTGIHSLTKNFPDFDQDKRHVYIGCFGTHTAKAVKDAGLRLDIQAPTKEQPSMVGALRAWMRENIDRD
ncbi:MAG: uroporphyrinogen-III synthase [Bacteroidales bacterium]|nr:uroporphyrinogen-III synthase [Bacteroidales bacterium]